MLLNKFTGVNKKWRGVTKRIGISMMRTIGDVLSSHFAGMEFYGYHRPIPVLNATGHVEIIARTKGTATMVETKNRSI